MLAGGSCSCRSKRGHNEAATDCDELLAREASHHSTHSLASLIGDTEDFIGDLARPDRSPHTLNL